MPKWIFQKNSTDQQGECLDHQSSQPWGQLPKKGANDPKNEVNYPKAGSTTRNGNQLPKTGSTTSDNFEGPS